MGAVLRERNALPYESSVTNCRLAKDAIDNGGAERAAKSAIPGRSLARYSVAKLLTTASKLGNDAKTMHKRTILHKKCI